MSSGVIEALELSSSVSTWGGGVSVGGGASLPTRAAVMKGLRANVKTWSTVQSEGRRGTVSWYWPVAANRVVESAGQEV